MSLFTNFNIFLIMIIFIAKSFGTESVSSRSNETKITSKNSIEPKKKISEVETYKLTYFNYRGRAEVIRLLFAQANVSYEDVRISRKEWPALKSKTPFGHVPILEVNGKVLAESHAIEKYLARKFGLLGADEWEAAKIDEIVMNLEDLRRKILVWIHEKNDTEKIEIFNKLMMDDITPFLHRYEQFLTNSGTGYFVGNMLSLADLAVFDILQLFDAKSTKELEKYPKLNDFTMRIEEMPKIKAWIEKRPKTSF